MSYNIYDMVGENISLMTLQDAKEFKNDLTEFMQECINEKESEGDE